MKRPNVKVRALVPADFEQHAARVGYTAEQMLWLLAERFCVERPGRVEIVWLEGDSTRSKVPVMRTAKRPVVRPLEVGDKVALRPHWSTAAVEGTKPRLKRGRVYCVRYTYRAPDGAQYVRLTGVACQAGDCGGETAILAEAFQRVGEVGMASGGKEAA